MLLYICDIAYVTFSYSIKSTLITCSQDLETSDF